MEFLGASLLVSLDIDDDVCALLDATIDKHTDDELDIAEGFSPATDEQASVVAFDLEYDGAVTEFVQDIRVDVDVHGGDEVGEDFAGYGLEFLTVLDGFDRGLGSPLGFPSLLSGGGFG